MNSGPVVATIQRPITRLATTLDRRFWLTAAGTTGIALLVLGLPTAVIPNPFFIRMTPVEAFNLVVWLASAPLIGLVTATYLAPTRDLHPARSEGTTRTGLASLGAFLAIGCPICNKVVVALLGVSGALSIFGPIQPVIGAASVGLLARNARLAAPGAGDRLSPMRVRLRRSVGVRARTDLTGILPGSIEIIVEYGE